MSNNDWLLQMGRLNYYAGQLSHRGDQYVAVARARELADEYERIASAPSSIASPAMSNFSLDDWSFARGAFNSPWPKPPAWQPMFAPVIDGIEPKGKGRAEFAVYTPESPCPDKVYPSGSRKKRRASVAPKEV